MLFVLIGAAAFGLSFLTFWFLLPRGGKPSLIAGSFYEAYIVVGLVGVFGLGVGFMIEGVTKLSE